MPVDSLLLDTDVLIDILRQENESAKAWFAGLGDYPNVSGIAAVELQYGAGSRKKLDEVNDFLSVFPILWPSALDIRRASAYAELALTHGIGVLDAITAAIAIRHDLSIVTFNIKHFRAVSNLVTVQPYKH